MLDEVDLFVLNNYRKGVSFDDLAKSLGREVLLDRIVKFKKLGATLVSGMEIAKINEFDLKVFNLLSSGLSVEDVSTELNKRTVDINASRKKFEDIGIRFPNAPVFIPNESKKNYVPKEYVPTKTEGLFIKYGSEGKSYEEISDLLNIDRHILYRVYRKLKRHGITVRVKKIEKEFIIHDIDKAIIKLRKDRKSLKQIAAEVGLKVDQVKTKIRRLKLRGIDVSVPISNEQQENQNKKVSKENLTQAMQNFIQSKNPTSEELSTMIEYASKEYGIDIKDEHKTKKDDIER